MTAFLLLPRNINCTITFQQPYALLSTIHLGKVIFFFFFAFLKQILYILSHLCYFLLLVNWSCPTLCYSINCSLLGYSVHGDSPGKNTGVGYHALLFFFTNRTLILFEAVIRWKEKRNSKAPVLLSSLMVNIDIWYCFEQWDINCGLLLISKKIFFFQP